MPKRTNSVWLIYCQQGAGRIYVQAAANAAAAKRLERKLISDAEANNDPIEIRIEGPVEIFE